MVSILLALRVAARAPQGCRGKQPLTFRMFSKCASRMLLSSRERRPELPTQGLWDAETQGGHIWVPKETQRLGNSENIIGKNRRLRESDAGTGLPAVPFLS